MKTAHRKLTAAVVAGMISAAQMVALGQDGGTITDQTQTGMSGATTTVRPGEIPPAPVATTTRGPLRGSLFEEAAEAQVPVGADGLSGDAPVSFIAVPERRPKKLRKNDVVTIVVEQDSSYSSTAASQSQKQQDFDLALQNWIQMHTTQNGVPTATSVGSSGTLPEAKFQYNNNRQNQASQTRQDTLSDRISATVVDVKPNGTLVVEAVAHVTVDKEVQIFRLTGICRGEDITADNTILSTQLADLNISKLTKGEVHDGVKSGWLNGLIDKVNPF
jgi:flagellar L-ring protein precursor FlgH